MTTEVVMEKARSKELVMDKDVLDSGVGWIKESVGSEEE